MNEHISRLVVRGGPVRPKMRFGRLRVLGEAFRVQYDSAWKQLGAVCECACGNVGVVACDELSTGKAASCGCVRSYLSRPRA
jgi:hypothetical protein